MKTNQIMKAVAVVTTLGVFLAGCSGGANTPTKSNSTPTNNTSSTIPPASGSGPTVGGGGTVTVGGNAITDDIRAAQIADEMKLDQILAATNASKDASESAENKANWAMWLGVGVAAFLGGSAIINGIRESNSEEGSFWSGLVGSRYGQTSEVAKAKAKEAVEAVNKNSDQRATEVKNDVRDTKSEVTRTRTSMDKQFGQVGADMATLKKAVGFNILATFGAIKAAAAAGAKVDQVLKGQDESLALEKVIKKNTSDIMSSQSKSAADIETMKGQLARAEAARAEMVTKIDTLVANTTDAATKTYLKAQFEDYKSAMDRDIADAREKLTKAIADAKVVVPPSPTADQVADAVAKKVGPQQPPQVFIVQPGSTTGAPAKPQTEEEMGKEHKDMSH